MDRLEGTYSVRSCGARNDGVHDDTEAIQEAVDKASEKGGGNVFLPPGHYRIHGTIDVRTGVTMYGIHGAPSAHTGLTGTVIFPTGGQGDPDADPLFRLQDSAMVRGFSVYYPRQNIDDITPYPWTFEADGADQTIENITLVNSYQGIRVGPAASCRHRITGLYGCVLRRGILIDNSWESGLIEDCQIHPHWWSHANVGGDCDKATRYMQEHLEAFTFGRSDGERMLNNRVFGAKIGWRFMHAEHGECSGHLTGCGADSCHTALQVEQLQRTGLLVTGSQFTALPGDGSCPVRVTKDCGQGNLRFANSAFSGPSNRIADLEGDCFASFNDCYFTNGKEGVAEKPLFLAKRGRIQINNCSFDSHHRCIELGPDLGHATIRGNNGTHGVSVDDQTGGKAIIADNEPPAQ